MNKILLNILNLSLALGIVACGRGNNSSSPTSSSSPSNNDAKKWDISLNSNDNVFAELVEYDNNYELVISGQGKMKSYKNKNDVPWISYVNSIESVLIGNGITNVGSNVFSDIDLEYIYLPDSIVDVEDNAANEETALLSYSDEVYYSDEVKNVYNKVEEDINIEDK